MSGLKTGTLTEISSQLSKNAQFKPYPGRATSLHVSNLFRCWYIAWIILMFDNQQELKMLSPLMLFPIKIHLHLRQTLPPLHA